MSASGDHERVRTQRQLHEVIVRQLKPSDREEWLRLLAQLYATTSEADHVASVDAFIARVQHEELLPSAVFVTERPEGGLCGFLELSVRNYAEGCTGETPYIESWFVDVDYRGRAVGRALVEAAENWARERGHTELASDTELDNTASQSAHRALGFEEVERTVHFRKSL
ncbi:MAG TPA: GNAT family N-acetyltransferase [Longimicrobiales bacterium]|nr:GNAT family N-acetyltransferase [Longimicrobiales bacterium]